MGEERDYSAQNQAVINRWEREMNRARAKAEASEENFQKTFADVLRSQNNKRALAREAKAAVDSGERGNVDPTLTRVREGGGAMYGDDDEVITGEEPRPWEDY